MRNSYRHYFWHEKGGAKVIHLTQVILHSDKVRLAATNALLNSLEFTKRHFDVENERNYIMQVVCESTQSADPLIRVAALQGLVKIMSLYYSYMEMYMGQALFAVFFYLLSGIF